MREANILPCRGRDAQSEASVFSIPPKSLMRSSVGNVLAIDNPGAVEIDDALSFRLGALGWVLQVSITDVGSHLYDQPAIRTAAEQRRKTTYANDKPVAPLLPDVLSGDLLSLRDGTTRPVVTVHLPVDTMEYSGQTHLTLNTAVVSRMTYAEADKALALGTSATLDHLKPLCDRLRQRRLQKYPEPVETRVSQANTNNVSSPSKKLVSEAMISANMGAAEYVVRHAIPGIFRTVTIPECYTTAESDVLRRYFGHPIPRVAYSQHPTQHDLLGHVYLPITSPLRSFVDFVNQCNLTAFLEQREYPYPADKIGEIIAALNRQHATTDAQLQAAFYTDLSKDNDVQPSASQLAAALFGAGSAPHAESAKKHALGYLLQNRHKARTVLGSAFNAGTLDAKVEPVYGGTMRVRLKTTEGAEASFLAQHTQHPLRDGQMVRIISQVAGLHVPPDFQSVDGAVEQRIMNNPQRYMARLHRRHALGYQTFDELLPDGTYRAFAYIKLGDELQQWSAVGATASDARSEATRQLIIHMDYIRRPPPFLQSFESFMQLGANFHPERCLYRVADVRGLPRPSYTASTSRPGYYGSTVRMESPAYVRQLTAVEDHPYIAKQRVAYKLLKCVLFDLRKMGRL